LAPRISAYESLYRKPSSGPQATNIGNRDSSSRATVVRNACGHVSGEPSGEVAQSWARIKAPTLIVAGDNDYITPSYHAQAIAGAIPGSKLVVFNGGGHSLSKTRPEEFNRTVLDFLGTGKA